MNDNTTVTSCYDYVIKNGKHVGDYEKMYQDCEDPWGQSETSNNYLSHGRTAIIQHLETNRIKSVVEVGCGIGFFTKMIKDNIPGIDIIGIDISETAIKKARERFRDIRFEVGNALNLQKYADCEAVLFAGVGWYILEDFDEILAGLRKHFFGKFFINWMPFYDEGVQEYGREYFTTLKEYIEYVPFENIAYTEAWRKDGGYETTAVFKISEG